jgi:DNA-binding NarL/FixJ family response regulator
MAGRPDGTAGGGLVKSSTNRTTVLVAVSDPIVGIGLETVLADAPETIPVGRVGGLAAVRPEVERLRPQVVLLDVAFRRADATLVPALTQLGARVIVLVDHPESECAFHQLATATGGRRLSPEALEMLDDCCLVSLRASAFGCLPRGASPDRLLAAIRTVQSGDIAAAPWLRETLQRAAAPRTVGPRVVRPITRRELEVITLIAEGLGNREIAARLGIREQTVKNHVNRIMTKLGARRRVEIGLFSLKHHLRLTPVADRSA